MKILQIIIPLIFSLTLIGFGSMAIWILGSNLGYPSEYRIISIAIFAPICILVTFIIGYFLIGRLIKKLN
jgi:hypothetical protein